MSRASTGKVLVLAGGGAIFNERVDPVAGMLLLVWDPRIARPRRARLGMTLEPLLYRAGSSWSSGARVSQLCARDMFFILWGGLQVAARALDVLIILGG